MGWSSSARPLDISVCHFIRRPRLGLLAFLLALARGNFLIQNSTKKRKRSKHLMLCHRQVEKTHGFGHPDPSIGKSAARRGLFGCATLFSGASRYEHYYMHFLRRRGERTALQKGSRSVILSS